MEYRQVHVVAGRNPGESIYVSSNQQPSLLQDRLKNIVRNEIYFCKTSGVPDKEYKAIISGFKKMIAEAGRRLIMKDFGYYESNQGAYGSPDWYQNNALTNRNNGFGTQISSTAIDDLLRNEPFQRKNPHYDVMIVDRDLTTTMNDAANNFVFGYGPYPNNIISIKRFIHWFGDPTLRQICLATIGAHEFGHNLELVGRNYDEDHGELRDGHCAGRAGACIMEQVQVSGKRTMKEQAKLLIEKEHWLCNSCIEELYFRKESLQKRGVIW